MVWSVQAGVKLEKLGIPTAVVVTDAFADMGQKTAKSVGLPGVAMAAAPHPFDCLGRAQVRKIAEMLYSEVKSILTDEAGHVEAVYASKVWPSAQEAVTSCRMPHRS